MSDHPQDLPTLTDDERRAHDHLDPSLDPASIEAGSADARSLIAALEELDAYRQAAAHISPTAHLARRFSGPRPFPGVRAVDVIRGLERAAGFPVAPTPDEVPDEEPRVPTWAQAVDGVSVRLRTLAADPSLELDIDDAHLDASTLRHLAAVLPMLDARAGAAGGSESEAALADVLTEARAVVATIARNGITADHLTGRLEPLRDAVRDLDRALDALPPAR